MPFMGHKWAYFTCIFIITLIVFDYLINQSQENMIKKQHLTQWLVAKMSSNVNTHMYFTHDMQYVGRL